MPDDKNKSSSIATSLVIAIVALLALAGLSLCGGFGLFFVRARSGGAPGQPVPANQSMLKRFVDDVIGVPPPPAVPPAPPPIAPPSAPIAPEPLPAEQQP